MLVLGALVLLALFAVSVSLLRMNYNVSSAVYVVATEAAEPLLCSTSADSTTPDSQLLFVDASQQLGKVNAPRTFSLTAADISGDGWDDLIIGTHNARPQLLINTGNTFRNESRKLTGTHPGADWHGIAAADIDNDGRLDLAVAGGGADGVGKGTANALFRNTTQRGFGVAFEKIGITAALAAPPARTRALLPVPSPSGEGVDLYSTALRRNGHPNQYWETRQTDQNLGLKKNAAHWLNGAFTDHGRGVIADFDNNGQADYLLINNANAEIIWAQKKRKTSILATYAFSAAAGDFNNDGLLDIYIGRMSPPTQSDQISSDGENIQFVIHQQQRVDHSSLSFRSELPRLHFNLKQNFRSGSRRYPANGKDIFLGRSRTNPDSRIITVNSDDAIGEPDNFRKSGIYIWYTDADRRWHMRWQFQSYAKEYKGTISGSTISDISTSNFTHEEADTTFDTLLINSGNGKFKRLCSSALSHRLTTSGVTLADLDSDGWLDIAGVRHAEQGAGKAEVFFLRNSMGEHFEKTVLPQHSQDLLYRPDLIVHGFFDRDNSPDLAFTYGFGQHPGTGGSPRLLLNQNPGGNDAMTIDLQGRSANAFGVGAVVHLRDSGNKRIGTRVVGLNANISQDTYLLHFGLGEASPPYELQVLWPDNTESRHTISKPGYHKVKQP